MPNVSKEKFDLAYEFWQKLTDLLDFGAIRDPIRTILDKCFKAWRGACLGTEREDKLATTEGLCDLAFDLLRDKSPSGGLPYPYLEGIFHACKGAIRWAKGDLDNAQNFLNQSAERFIDSDCGYCCAAVVKMARSDILFQKPCDYPEVRQQNLEEALKICQRTLYDLDCSRRPGRPEVLKEEVRSRIDDIIKALYPEAQGDTANFSRTSQASTQHESSNRGAQELPTFPVMGLASAGASVLTPDKIDGYGVTDTITVNGEPYNIHPLKSAQDFSLRFHHDYFISPVEGNSMNLAGIQNGDYVLFERPSSGSPDPKNGDIVLAVVYDQEGAGESGMILKRYCKEGKEFWLKPESSEEGYKARKVSPGDVRAIAIAVLKKI